MRSVVCVAMIVGAGCASGVGDGQGGASGAGVSETIDPMCPPAPAGASMAPTTILDAIGMANALYAAKPAASPSLSLSCFVQRLSRPLTTLGVQSVFSLQPADGERNPRIFLFSGALVMSVVPGGPAADRIELAEYPNPLRSIKAEMAFPLTAPLPPNEPFDRIRNSTGTVCGGCHRDEQPSPQFTFTKVYESGVFRPRPQDMVPLPYMEDQARACNPQQEPYRCAVLRAVFDRGQISTGAFSPDAPTIFD